MPQLSYFLAKTLFGSFGIFVFELAIIHLYTIFKLWNLRTFF